LETAHGCWLAPLPYAASDFKPEKYSQQTGGAARLAAPPAWAKKLHLKPTETAPMNLCGQADLEGYLGRQL
jgi:hypothetical protein